MQIRTPFTRLFGLHSPVVLAPMGGVAGGLLAATVTNAGGLGLVGGGYGDADWLARELEIVRREANGPWGVGLISWSLRQSRLDQVLAHRPAAVMLSFGSAARWAPSIKARGVRLFCQVQDRPSADEALSAGADVLVAQGTEAGGHGGQRATLPLVPAIVDLAGSVPVLAAGGIADGRGLAAALMLGAQGALIGTRFYASQEALGHPRLKHAITTAAAEDTVRTSVFDALRDYPWPPPYEGRALRTSPVTRWHHRVERIAPHRAKELRKLHDAQEAGNSGSAMVWAGECVDLIHGILPAADIVRSMADEAVRRLRHGLTVLDG